MTETASGFMTAGIITALLVEWEHAPLASELKEHWYANLPSCTVPKAGMYEMLHHLKNHGVQLGLITRGTGAITSRISRRCANRRGRVRLIVSLLVPDANAGGSFPSKRRYTYPWPRLGQRFHGDRRPKSLRGASTRFVHVPGPVPGAVPGPVLGPVPGPVPGLVPIPALMSCPDAGRSSGGWAT